MSFSIERRTLPGAESLPEKPRRSPWRWLPFLLLGALLWWGRGAFSWKPSAETLALGREVFVHEWTANDALAGEGDGLGPVFNERSCVACHFQGGIGGGGTNDFNVETFHVVPTENRPEPVNGVIHASATRSEFRETFAAVRTEFPIEKGTVAIIDGCRTTIPDFDPLRVESVNTPPLFGLGLVEKISDWSIRRRNFGRSLGRVGSEFQGDFDETPSGRIRKVDGGFGKFGWKGQFATLEDFVATACAVELGLSNPLRRQDAPGTHAEDSDAKLDIDRRQLRALVAFVRELPRPEQILPTDPTRLAEIERGESHFTKIGCSDCHPAELGGIEGFYSDLSLHSLKDPEGIDPYGPAPPVPSSSSGDPLPEEWKTPPLWGVADSAPYMHDGSAGTLEQAIQRHGGQARHVRQAFVDSKPAERASLLKFLGTLRAPATAAPLPGAGNAVANR